MTLRLQAYTAAVALACCCTCWQANGSNLRWPLTYHRIAQYAQGHSHHKSIFANPHEQEEAYRIYRELQDEAFQALHNALAPSEWEESVAIRFASQPELRDTLIWDVFGYRARACDSIPAYATSNVHLQHFASTCVAGFQGRFTIVRPNRGLEPLPIPSMVASGCAA